jgi:hypothetical protein
MGYWRNVVTRAWRKSLQLVRWDDPLCAAVPIASAIGTFVVGYWWFGDSAVGLARVIIGLGFTAALALAFFLWKLIQLLPVIHAEQEARIGQLIKYSADLQVKFVPTIEILGLLNEADMGGQNWFIQVHNTSLTKSLSDCVAHLVEIETFTAGGTLLGNNLTLGTQNQWRDKRERGRFNLHPDETKNIRLLAPLDQPDKFFRLSHGQDNGSELLKGSYRLKLRARAADCPAAFKNVLIDDKTVRLEAAD